jgi:hypothetical protein
MPRAELEADMFQAFSVLKENNVTATGFRARWLVVSRDAYRTARTLGLRYASNVKAKKAPQIDEEYDLVELPIYLDDQALLQENAVDLLLNSCGVGRVFEFHLLYVRQTMELLDEFLSKLQTDTATLQQIAEGKKAFGLSFDIAYLSRWELIKKLVA